MTNRPLYLADICESEDKMLSLSIVSRPATKCNFRVIGSDGDNVRLFAPVILANTPIYRENEQYGKHDVMFLPDVISDMMMDANDRHIRFDVEHSGKPIEGVRVISSYQIDYSKRTLYSDYQGLTDGSWVMLLQIKNAKTLISRLIDGDLRRRCRPLDILEFSNFGLSISGIFSYHRVELSEAIEFLKN